MNLTTIQVLALIVIIFSLVKLIIIGLNKKVWISFAKKVYSNPVLTKIYFLILAAIVFYFLITSGLSVTQILAVTLFVILFMGMALSEYALGMIKTAEKISLKNLIRKHGAYIVIWTALIIYSLLEIFYF